MYVYMYEYTAVQLYMDYLQNNSSPSVLTQGQRLIKLRCVGSPGSLVLKKHKKLKNWQHEARLRAW